MKKSLIFHLLLLTVSLTSTSCKSQSTGYDTLCPPKIFENKKSYLKQIPPDLCMSNEWEITSIYRGIDFNCDSIEDFAFRAWRTDKKDGDRIRFQMCQLDSTGRVVWEKIYYNVWPKYYKRYDIDYIITLPDSLQKNYFYSGSSPLRALEFDKDKLLLTVDGGVMEGIDLLYQFDSEIRDWRLIEVKSWVENIVGEKRYESLEFTPQTLSDFNYRDYL